MKTASYEQLLVWARAEQLADASFMCLVAAKQSGLQATIDSVYIPLNDDI